MKSLKIIDLENVLFIDIETAPVVPVLKENTPLYDSWAYKTKYSRESNEFAEQDINESFKNKAALYPEFSKIVCITIGKIKDEKILLKSFYGHDEKELLVEFVNTVNKIISANKNIVLCGHAIIGFDLPFIFKRCIINQIEPPAPIDIGHLKPWEINCLDTMKLWNTTGFSSASLINITTALGLPSPKYEMAGYDSTKVYYNEENGLEKIVRYCERDVTSVANIVRVCRFEPPLESVLEDIKVEKVGLVQSIFNKGGVEKEEESTLKKVLNKLNKEEKQKADEILKSLNVK